MKKRFKDIFKKFYEYIKKKIEYMKLENSKLMKSVYLKYFLIFSVIYLIAFIPLFRANFNYIDDLGRKFSGYRSFGFSRDGSDFLSIFVHGSKYLTDISPFTQIIAIAIISLASTIVIKLIARPEIKDKINIWYIFATIPIGLSPYYLENFSYKFDSPYMALSVLFSIIPFLYYKKNEKINKNILFLFIGSFCTTLMCITYQASSGIFPSITIALTLLMIHNKDKWKEIFKFILLSILSFGIGILFFKFFIMKHVDMYVNNDTWNMKEMIPGLIKNYKEYFKIILVDFKRTWIIAIFILIISFFITNIIKTKRNKIIEILYSLITLIFLGIFSFGLYPMLKQPLFQPRAMYGIGVTLSIISLMAVDYKRAYIPKVFTFYIAYIFFILALTYGNALSEQKRYTEYRISLIAYDLNNIDVKENDTLYIRIKGNIGRPNDVNKLVEKNRILDRLIPVTFGDDSWVWAGKYFYDYFNLPNIKKSTKDLDVSAMKLYKETRYHNIYKNNNKIIIELK